MAAHLFPILHVSTVAFSRKPSTNERKMIAYARLHGQRLSSGRLRKPEEVVSWLGAVQAQDYVGAKWALAMRMERGTDAAVERAFAAGTILRTHVMRPTWHFVTPADIRWMLGLTAPRVRAAVAYYEGRLEIDPRLIRRSNKVIAAALADSGYLTRQELRVRLRKAGIAADGVQRLAHLMMHAELAGVVCSGPVRGKQFTYALLEQRVPQSPTLSRDAALAELTRRYFTSHGPAQVQDFVWWSGLTTAEARAGLEMVGRDLDHEVMDSKMYWFSRSRRRPVRPAARTAYLLPPYDEYLIGYKDRSAALDLSLWKSVVDRDPFTAPIVLDGQVVGGWKRTITRQNVTVVVKLPASFARTDSRLVTRAAHAFGAFLDLPVMIARM